MEIVLGGNDVPSPGREARQLVSAQYGSGQFVGRLVGWGIGGIRLRRYDWGIGCRQRFHALPAPSLSPPDRLSRPTMPGREMPQRNCLTAPPKEQTG